MRRATTLTCVFLIVCLTHLAAAQTPQSARRTPLVTVVEKVSPAVVNISAQSTVREADPFFGLFGVGGDVIGINSAIISGATGIGFAIPADRARRVVDDLLRFGELQPLWSGARLLTVDPELARRSGIASRRGALVFKVYPDSPAAAAGLQEKDVIVAAGGHPVVSREDVGTALYTAPAGSPVELEVRRGDRTLKVGLKPVHPPQGLGLQVLERSVGLKVEPVQGGLAIRQVANGSVAAERGLRPGDVILGANGQQTASAEALGREVLRGLDRGSLPLSVQRGRWVYNLDFPL